MLPPPPPSHPHLLLPLPARDKHTDMYNSLPHSMLSMFTTFMLWISFEYFQLPWISQSYQLFGILIYGLYVIVGGIMSLNLLIAIMLVAYKPDDAVGMEAMSRWAGKQGKGGQGKNGGAGRLKRGRGEG